MNRRLTTVARRPGTSRRTERRATTCCARASTRTRDPRHRQHGGRRAARSLRARADSARLPRPARRCRDFAAGEAGVSWSPPTAARLRPRLSRVCARHCARWPTATRCASRLSGPPESNVQRRCAACSAAATIHLIPRSSTAPFVDLMAAPPDPDRLRRGPGGGAALGKPVLVCATRPSGRRRRGRRCALVGPTGRRSWARSACC